MNITSKTKATLWKEVNSSKNTITRVISTYEGKDKDDNPVYSQWLARFVGDSFKLAKKLDEKERILLTNAKVENVYNKSTKTSTAVITVFKFELDEED